ncbi:MAG: LuxR C-terminal-related transcriptional regulator [Thermomicrobiales bacterium]
MKQEALERTIPPGPTAPVGVRVARTALVGREREIATATALLRRDDVRLLVLVGPGGVGKTRLAVRVAEELAEVFPGGVLGVDLCPLSDPDHVPHAVAAALGLRDRGDGGDGWEQLRSAFARKPMMLVLDNLDHLMAATPAIGDLLAAAPLLRILITSRERVPLADAHHLVIPPLALPEPRSPVGNLGSAPAVRLFIMRAEASDSRFAVTSDDVATIGEVCRRLDGLPLAIELAAARVSILPPRAMLARLDHALPLLTTGPIDATARHRTMRAAITWGYDLLTPPLQRLFRSLSVFRGGFTLDAAEWIASRGQDGIPLAEPGGSTLDLLAALIDRSLVQILDDTGEPRYGMLETLREFGREALAAHPTEAEPVLRRHAEWVAAEVAIRAREAFAQVDEDVAFTHLDAERANITAALDFATTTGKAAIALGLIGDLWLYWTTRGSLREDARWIDRLLAMPELATVDPAIRAAGLCGASWLAALRGKDSAVSLADAALSDARRAADAALEARALVMRSLALGVQGHFPEARAAADEAVTVARGSGDRDWLPFALNRHGVTLLASGDLAEAGARFEEALALWQHNGFGWGIGTALENLAGVTRQLGQWDRAVALYHEQLRLPGDPRDVWGTVNSLCGLAEITIGAGDAARGARLLGAAEHLREESGIALAGHEAERFMRTRQTARTALGTSRYTAEEQIGRDLGYDEALATAFAVSAPRTAGALAGPAGLSPREIEVLRLLATGASDRDIADRLYLSARTVETHVAAIRRKLGAANRAEAAVAAVRLGLVDDPPERA